MRAASAFGAPAVSPRLELRGTRSSVGCGAPYSLGCLDLPEPAPRPDTDTYPAVDIITVGNGAAGNETMAQLLPNLPSCPAGSLKYSYGNGTGFATITINPADGPLKPSTMTVAFYDSLGDKIYQFSKTNQRKAPKLATPVEHRRISTPDKVMLITLLTFFCCTVCYTARYRLRDPDAPSLLVRLAKGRGAAAAAGKDAGGGGPPGGGSYSSFAPAAPVELDMMGADPSKDPSVASAFRMFGLPADGQKKTAGRMTPDEMHATNRIRERMRQKASTPQPGGST